MHSKLPVLRSTQLSALDNHHSRRLRARSKTVRANPRTESRTVPRQHPLVRPENVQGSTHEEMRRHNLSTILRMVHFGGPITRSNLAILTGLNKSTIGALSKELIDLGLVEEIIPNRNDHVGRPSRVVAPNERVIAIAINPEVDAVTIGIVSLGGKVTRRVRYAIRQSSSAAEAVNLATAFIDGMRAELERDYRVIGIGVAIPGAVHSPDGSVTLAPHLGWAREPIVEMLTQATGYPVLADNDGRLGSLAERNFGAGADVKDLIYINGWGHGISGGIISGGMAVSGFSGYAAAFGHVKSSNSEKTDSAGICGTFEADATRSALLDALGITDAGPDELEQALLAATSQRVRKTVERQLDYLAIVLGNVINIVNPKLIVLGGFLASLHAMLPDYLPSAVAARALPAAYAGVEIRPSGLGSNLLLIGAAELVFEDLLDDPAHIRSEDESTPDHT